MEYTLIGFGAEAKIFLVKSNQKVDNKYLFTFDHKALKNLAELDIPKDYHIKIEYEKENLILKIRFMKRYRHYLIDKQFRKYRTRIEKKILEKLYTIINVPKVIYSDEDYGILIMEYIEGEKLSNIIEQLDDKNIRNILFEIGKYVGIMHNNDIIHYDLTTSNMIINNNNIYFIDFGLSFISSRIEDKAVDIHIFKESYESKHWRILEYFNSFFEGYVSSYEKAKEVLKRLKIVENRGRYKNILY